MKYFLSVLMIFVSISFIFVISAQTTSAISFPPTFPPYRNFGAKVITYIPQTPATLTCLGFGTLVMTTGSLLPVYAKNPLKIPTPMGKILAKTTLFPSLTTCFNLATGVPVPIPVLLTTSNYGVSR